MAKDQLRVLIGDRAFETSLGDVTLRPFKFKEFPAALAIVEEYLKIFTSFETTGEMIEELLAKKEDKYQLLEDIQALLSLVSAKTVEWGDLGYDEILGLLAEVIAMNLDFFSRIGKTLNQEKDGQSESAA